MTISSYTIKTNVETKGSGEYLGLPTLIIYGNWLVFVQWI